MSRVGLSFPISHPNPTTNSNSTERIQVDVVMPVLMSAARKIRGRKQRRQAKASALGTDRAYVSVSGVVSGGAVRSRVIRTRAKHGKSTNEPDTPEVVHRRKADTLSKRATGRRGADVDGIPPTRLRKKPLILLRGRREGADMKPGRERHKRHGVGTKGNNNISNGSARLARKTPSRAGASRERPRERVSVRHKTTPETLLARESSDGSLSNDGNESDHLWASASLHAGLPKELWGSPCRSSPSE
jgi:hypothetical protein